MRSQKLTCQILLPTLFLAFHWTIDAQNKTQRKEAQKQDEFKVVDHFPLIVLGVEVKSRTTGLVVNDLTHEDFLISENHVRQTIAIWQQHNAPLSLLILIDTRGENHVIDSQLNSLKSALATSLTTRDEASVVVIAERPVVFQDFTANRELIADAFERALLSRSAIPPPAEQRFSAALEQAAKREGIARNFKGLKATILISNIPKAIVDKVVLPEKVVRAILQSASIFCWNGAADSSPHVVDSADLPFDSVSLIDLVSLTGGEVVGSDWKSFVERLRERHLIGFVPLPVPEKRNGELVRIKLQLAPNPNRHTDDLVLTYPRAAAIPSSK